MERSYVQAAGVLDDQVVQTSSLVEKGMMSAIASITFPASIPLPISKRWRMVVAATIMQVALGAIHGWSVFRAPLVETFGWTMAQVTATYTIAMLTTGFAAFFGGLWLNRLGPRLVGVTAGCLYGLGVALSSCTGGNLLLFYLTYGIVGGSGIGLGFVIPVATLVKWFPDKRGLVSGIAVAGFGAGPLLVAPLAIRLIMTVGVSQAFACLGLAYLLLVVGAALCLENPPAGYRPAGWQPSATRNTPRNYTVREALQCWQWYLLWLLLFVNTTAGTALIAHAAGLAQELTRVEPLVATGLVGMLAIANTVGRFVWPWLSDYISRDHAFVAMFGLQAVVFCILPLTSTFALFGMLAMVVLLCFGGGFSTMAAWVADYFGPKHLGATYGLILTAVGFGAALGPLLLAISREATGAYTLALHLVAALLLLSIVVPFFLHPPHGSSAEEPKGVLGFSR